MARSEGCGVRVGWSDGCEGVRGRPVCVGRGEGDVCALPLQWSWGWVTVAR